MSAEILNINITETELGKHWVLRIAGKETAGGYEQTTWLALDKASEALVVRAQQIKRLVEGER